MIFSKSLINFLKCYNNLKSLLLLPNQNLNFFFCKAISTKGTDLEVGMFYLIVEADEWTFLRYYYLLGDLPLILDLLFQPRALLPWEIAGISLNLLAVDFEADVPGLLPERIWGLIGAEGGGILNYEWDEIRALPVLKLPDAKF